MMTNIISVDNVVPAQNESYFFDANILFYLFNSYNNNLSADRIYIDKYSDFFAKLINANSSIYISSLTLSEFVNGMLRREYIIITKKPEHKDMDYKYDFRGSKDYNDVMDFIKPTISSIFKQIKKINDSFENIDIINIFENIEADFNDEYYIKLCEAKNIKFVTNDSDFKSANTKIDIITANRSLLK